MVGISVSEARAEVLQLLVDVPEGEGLDAVTLAMVRVAVLAAPTTLDLAGTESALDTALDLGASAEQLQELLVLISGVGMHTLIGTSRALAGVLRARSAYALDADLGGAAAELAGELIGSGGRESRVAEVAPDFWPNLLRLSSIGTVRAVAAFRAAPWAETSLTSVQRELVGIAVDSMPTHRFLPTLLMHVRQAIQLGVGARAIRQVLDVSSAAPEHPGVR